jgi:(R)-2-hydroxyacyl-CoA dehydratese activating ATPase
MNGHGEVLSYKVVETIPDIDQMAEQLRRMALKEAKLKVEQIDYVMSTGYGRNTVSFAQENRTEILCHAAGVHSLFPTVKTIIDIGGQDSKVIKLDDTGRVINFTMNNKCAAGTGRFTEVMSRALKIELGRWGEVVASADDRAKISNICTVFAESEVISKLMQQVPINEILAGVCESIASRIFESVQRMGGAEQDVAFTGGVANNLGVKIMLEEKVGVKLMVPQIPQSTGALGAAYLARQFYTRLKEKMDKVGIR